MTLAGIPALASPSDGVLTNHLDVFATAPVSGRPGNLGVAAGIRLGNPKGIAIVPLANFTQVNRKYFVEPGVALTVPLGKRTDFGIAEIGKQGSDLALRRGRYETSVVLGIRL